MRILYLTQWFEPEPNIIKGLAFVRALQAAGHEVTVVTGLPNYPTGRIYPGYRLRLVQHEDVDGVRITRLPLYPSHDTSTVRRSLTFLSFFVAVLVYCLFRAGRYDLAYVYHPPITVGLAAALAGCVRRLPFVLDVQDLWPETVSTTGLKGAAVPREAARLGLPVRLPPSRLIIAQRRPGCGRRWPCAWSARGEKSATVRNWAACEEPAPPGATRCRGIGGALLGFVYAGNFGRAQHLETVVEAAAILARGGRTSRSALVGDGVEAAEIRERARRGARRDDRGAGPARGHSRDHGDAPMRAAALA